MFLRAFSTTDLYPVYDLARNALSERYDPTLFTTISNSWPEGFTVVDSPWGIKAFILGIMTSPVQSRVLMLAVSEDMRRKGIGTMLMEHFFQEARKKGARMITLEVRRSNAPALEFYHKLGFHPVSMLPGYYNDGEDAFQMHKFLFE